MTTNPVPPVAATAADVPSRAQRSIYPAPFAARFDGRDKKPLGTVFGLTNFGVNLTRLASGAASSLRHAHTRQDEFVYVLEGEVVLYTDAGATALSPGMCAGFRAGTGDAHRLVNASDRDAVYLEVGDRTAGDEATYPDDDLVARLDAGAWRFFRKDGTPY
ncbi:cupin domain-containing protein [Tahibacter caeni]|uniref:cupin domain-containing protein n=1 Tax=Tahibacter caeni TaxID=1453545 RepID=UPI00214998E3|nr:cupin domain-containing protein [Tahibacter caeni]